MTDQMTTLVQTGPKAVEPQQQDKPTPDKDELLVEVHTATLCGSDAHAYSYEGGYEWIPIPRIMGHEYAGTVVDVGPGVSSVEVGDRIVGVPLDTCGECFQCKNGQANVCQEFSITGMHEDGAYAEYTTETPDSVHQVPDGLSLEHAALTEPVSIATRAVFTQSDVEPGDTVLVQGPGPIGVLVAAVADSMGANVLVSGLSKDTVYRLPLVGDLGIDTIDAQETDLEERTAEFTDSIGFDVVFDTTGHHTGPEGAVDHVRKGGQIVVVGIPGEPAELFFPPLVRGEIDVNTSYGSTWRNFEQALRLMENGTIDPGTVIDQSYSIQEPEAAFTAFLESETCKPAFSFGEL